MSIQFLKNLNGDNDGYFKKWLSNYDNHSPNIAWYPSSGLDFRDILYFNKEYADKNSKIPDWVIPDLFIHTDFYKPDFDSLFTRNMIRNFTKPLSRMESLFREYADLSGWHLFNDGRTSVRVVQFEVLKPIEINDYDLKHQNKLVTLDIDESHFKNVYYMKLDIGSDKFGHFESHLIYINILNETFANLLVNNNAEVSHITHVRYGSAFGGARALGSYLVNILPALKSKFFISDPYTDNYSDNLPGMVYKNLKYNHSTAISPIHVVKSKSWSNHGDVSFYKVSSQ